MAPDRIPPASTRPSFRGSPSRVSRTQAPWSTATERQARDFTYIDDVIEANLLAERADDHAQGRTFNIGGGAEPTSVNDILRIVSELTRVSPDPVFELPRQGDVQRTEADISLAREFLGYSPTVDIRLGLERVVEHLRATIELGSG